MHLATRNSPLIHSNNKCPDQPAHRQSYRRVYMEKKSEILSEFQLFRSVEFSAHERHTRIKSGGGGGGGGVQVH